MQIQSPLINMDPAPTTKLSFSFKAKPKPKATTGIPPQSSAFAALDDDPVEEDFGSSKSSRPGITKPKSLVPTQVVMTKAMKREMEEQKKVDATVYQYDEVYDRLKEADRQAELAREEEAKIRQVYCHISRCSRSKY
jgi:coiled-coil domain-containing protein 55